MKYLTRLGRGGRNYLAAVLINLALVQTALTPPPRRSVAQVRLVAGAGPFSATELLWQPGAGPAVLCLPLDPARLARAISDN